MYCIDIADIFAILHKRRVKVKFTSNIIIQDFSISLFSEDISNFNLNVTLPI